MSIKGRPAGWFEAAIRRGDLTAALSELAELPRPLAPRYAQVTLADPGVDLAALAELVRALAAAPRLGMAGREGVAALAERHGVGDVSGLLSAAGHEARQRLR